MELCTKYKKGSTRGRLKMWELVCLNLKNNERFTKTFYNYLAKENFIRKCKYSNKIKIVAIYNCI